MPLVFYAALLALLIALYIIKKQSDKIRLLETFTQDSDLLIDKISLPIFVKDKNGFYIECNKAFLEIVDKNIKDIINTKNEDEELLYELHCELDQELLTTDTTNYIEIFALKSKKPKMYKFYKSAIKKDGLYNGYTCVMIDITDTEKKENTLQYEVHKESEKNKFILQKHEEERLKSAKFTAIGQLAAGITHEINTPLTYVKGNLEILKMDIEDMPKDITIKDQLVDTLEDMESGVLRIITIINSMREMAEQNKIELKRANVYSTIITSLIMTHNRSKQTSKIYINDEEFQLDSPKDKYELYADIEEQRVEQVWIVIINNALDELQKIPEFRDRTLKISAYQEGANIIVRFSDNGGGIPNEIMDDLFEPFISGKPESGMGVGLSIAKRILDSQNATIRAYNENNGAVFEIIIPAG